MIKYQLAWVLYDGQYDPVDRLFDSLNELKNFAESIFPRENYVWRPVDVEMEK